MANTTRPSRTRSNAPKASDSDHSQPGGETSRGWLVVVAVAAGIALVVGAYVVWDRNWRTAGPDNPRPDCPAVVPAGDRRPLAMRGVDRVMLIGDSIMDEASCAVAESLSGLGVETSRRAVGGSGLLNSPLDWVTTAERLLAAEKPDVVLAVFVGNYIPPAPDASGRRIEIDSPEFFAAWQQRAEELSRVVRAAGAQLYWVSPPPIERPPLSHAGRLFEGYTKIEGDRSLNAGEALAGDDGEHVADTITCGRRRAIRAWDGTHLTADGARIYGQSIAHELSADLGVLTSPRPC